MRKVITFCAYKCGKCTHFLRLSIQKTGSAEFKWPVDDLKMVENLLLLFLQSLVWYKMIIWPGGGHTCTSHFSHLYVTLSHLYVTFFHTCTSTSHASHLYVIFSHLYVTRRAIFLQNGVFFCVDCCWQILYIYIICHNLKKWKYIHRGAIPNKHNSYL